MIDFSLPDDSRLLVETVRKFVEAEVQPLEEATERDARIPPEELKRVRAKAQELGLYAMNMPESVGGGGLSCVDHCLVEEEFGKTADALIRRVFGQVYPMLLACKDEQREKYLLPTVRGEKICAMAITEPGAGSDAASITTTAERDGDEWVLKGTKHFISDGDIADYVIVMALTDREKRARGGITLFLVDKGTPGFSVARTQPMMGHRGYGHAELVFDNCRIPASAVLGEIGAGFKLIMQSVLEIRLAHIGARAVGMASRALELMRRYAGERRQFGQAIGDFQMVQKLIADSAIEIFAVKMMVLNAAWEIDQGLEPRDKVSMIKVAASEMQGRVVDRAIQVFGGMGFTKEMPLERMYRDARVTRIYDGTSEIHRMLIARSTIKNGLNL
ncbi:acyl-CoA dehydrogenase [Rhizobium oryzihabitans]|jgi:acyl-CoA dehydrogenase|uniref:Medium-chain specific acyl-CoA dehydrogenase, mitochondrial n=1 Tax=Rhizobium oryzihabitans TaxID=2267833 RepID=A0A7L5BP20_9HYPH|nr:MULTISPECIES: acyl-CoA dehydrogenase family protein [Rhizobium]MCW0981095.1 acyl-CoA dehydrogenase family protein [Agrobacterium sp. BT-220-3]QCM07361.1 acyl-CoA dehydrogenase [Agrobacterium tumefaciens]CUX58958.1 Acyl-CoA dehydrogenase [Agrobacterium genomosp. 5 str. CFBP 6626]HBT67421.1 acyl-CoA dehydrogenase [Agrobacterium sp.]QIB40366.1 acyl-CoA dehydrogenase [Rhizobium oryzihabitans]